MAWLFFPVLFNMEFLTLRAFCGGFSTVEERDRGSGDRICRILYSLRYAKVGCVSFVFVFVFVFAFIVVFVFVSVFVGSWVWR